MNYVQDISRGGKMGDWIIVVCIVFAFVLVLKKTRKRGSRPPGPRGLPIIGNLHQLGTEPHRSLFELSKKYGPVMYLKLGSVPTVVVSTPESIKDVLKTFDAECCSRPNLAYAAKLTYNLSDLSFSPYNEYWKELRKMSMLELYNPKRVRSFRYIRQEEVAAFLDFVEQSASSGTPVNFNQKLLSLSGCVIFRLGLGMKLRGTKLEEKYDEVVVRAMNMLGSFPAADFFPYFGWIIDRLTGLHKRCDDVFQELDAIYELAIKQHVENECKEGEEDIVDLLLKMEKGKVDLGQFRLTQNHIKGILKDLVLAGTDTSAQTVTWAMAHLITNPRVMTKVQTEIRERIKNKDDITEDDIEQLDYLKMVIKETFRINPIAPLLIPREAMNDVKINGYDVPKDTRIQVNIWAIHRDPNVWRDPECFIPERFMDNQIEYKGQNFELLPFGSGRRMCPGMGMGMALVHLTLINLLYRFDWKLPEGMKIEDVDLKEEYGLATPKKIPLRLVPVVTQWT